MLDVAFENEAGLFGPSQEYHYLRQSLKANLSGTGRRVFVKNVWGLDNGPTGSVVMTTVGFTGKPGWWGKGETLQVS